MSEEMKETAEQTPTLTFDPFEEEVMMAASAAASGSAEPQAPVVQEIPLTPEEQRMVDEFASKIELSNTNLIIQYGSGAQKKIAEFSESALNNVRTKDLGEVGNLLSNVVTELKSFDAEEDEKGFLGIFKRTSRKLSNMKTKYDKAETNVNKICSILENHQIQLLKDVAMLDKMYDMNKVYFKELSMYILAGKKKLNEVRTAELPKLTEKAQASGLPEDAQAANDLSAMCSRFEKKIYDLELTRMISIQMAPQIRLVQNNDTLMSDKIQSTLVNTIPLWKSQMVLALGIANSQQAAQSQRKVTDMTNELLRKNAATLKMATIDTAKESERGIVDIETLVSTNQSLISTLEEVTKIQEEGRLKRAQAEKELSRIEGELKQKLLEIRK
ncbi:toxic anion resistance protein [Sinanaerobacter chloroacetimidivorans]|uniref:Toxic anion resistance protein n=1 Tax=Sinanaerobacter chloroacetimidivorans TaxID=2818044 RepID=A0A8J7W2E1_9FIRM|nr:toxic anion resistance protein [Sinanaerobacter chloroacetimidivorans]MBR0599637.1 toxic anion resistance protein [Sinanaerobacter chloroacetimidivorans]